MAQYNHTGVPVTAEQPGESYLDGGKVYYTDPEAHPYGFEFLRFDADSPMPDELKTLTHIAFKVDSLEEAMPGCKVIMEPFEPFPGLSCAFVMKDGVLLELMQDV